MSVALICAAEQLKVKPVCHMADGFLLLVIVDLSLCFIGLMLGIFGCFIGLLLDYVGLGVDFVGFCFSATLLCRRRNSS